MQFIHDLHFNNLRGDIYGGIVAAVVALPLALAFGVASGAGAIAELIENYPQSAPAQLLPSDGSASVIKPCAWVVG